MGFRFDLPTRIALFPLCEVVMLPRAKLPLHIFEPRYLQLLDDVLKTDHRLIGMIQPDGNRLAAIGSAGRVIAFSESEDGRMMISLRAVSRFRLAGIEDGFTPYRQGEVDWAGFERDLDGPETDPGLDRSALLDKLRRYAEALQLSADLESAAKAADETLINAFSMMLPFSSGEKQALLEARTLTDRRVLLEGLMDYALHGGENEEPMQ
ncbi:LON peptidase substrate-binding domain-containing protein [Paracoccus methylarcula]|uniref:ATP-dependent protease n=1 Tax=Paracoccus methylarcula TaxID=72022 RepID=A0A422QXG9_9RHOB|nr:LON peptidase substrate-binding domain-containing protein [Paracoccus methylarcula]RNF34665.1 ATP-dependent protease [Paracoccus methylarcula]